MYCGDASTFSPCGPIELDAVEALAVDSLKLPVSVPSAWTDSGAAAPSLNRICPPGVFIVGVMCSSTSVPRSAATSPPFSSLRGGRFV